MSHTTMERREPDKVQDWVPVPLSSSPSPISRDEIQHMWRFMLRLGSFWKIHSLNRQPRHQWPRPLHRGVQLFHSLAVVLQ